MEYSDLNQLQKLIQNRGQSSTFAVKTSKIQRDTRPILKTGSGLLTVEENDNEQNQESVDSGGGMRIQDLQFMSKSDSNKDDEPICFDQTTRHIGSIQKNMVLMSHRDAGSRSKNVWGQTALRDNGRIRDDDEPNYSQFK